MVGDSCADVSTGCINVPTVSVKLKLKNVFVELPRMRVEMRCYINS